jgi:hypothetical protein
VPAVREHTDKLGPRAERRSRSWKRPTERKSRSQLTAHPQILETPTAVAMIS